MVNDKEFNAGRITGEQLMSALQANQSLRVNIKTQPYLSGNRGVLIGDDLFVSKDVQSCLADQDTCSETMKGLSIVIMPKIDLRLKY